MMAAKRKPRIYEQIYFNDEKLHKELIEACNSLGTTLSAVIREITPAIIDAIKIIDTELPIATVQINLQKLGMKNASEKED